MTTLPAPLLWTLDDYHQLIDSGLLAGRRVQLLEGQLIEMPPMNSPHIGAMKYLYRVFVLELGDRVSSQTPIIIPARDDRPASEPEPDVFVSEPGAPLKPRIEQVALIIEVSDSTVQNDRAHKVTLYRAAGAPEVWLVDLQQHVVHVYRRGHPEDRYRASSHLAPLCAPQLAIDVAAIFTASQQP
jgi:Uma2 family endonuclease